MSASGVNNFGLWNGQGYMSQTRNVLNAPFGQTSEFQSKFGNSYSNLNFKVQSFLPGDGQFSTTQKAQQFSAVPNDEFAKVLYSLGRANVIDLPVIGLGQFLADPTKFLIAPDYAATWGNFFSVPSRFTFPTAYTV